MLRWWSSRAALTPDMACRDILRKATGVPCDVLPGGKHRDRGRLFKAVSRADSDTLAAKLAGYRVEGYTRLRMKVGDDPDRDIDRIRRVAKEVRAGDIPVADENTSRKQYEAMHVAAAVGDQTRERPACRP